MNFCFFSRLTIISLFTVLLVAFSPMNVAVAGTSIAVVDVDEIIARSSAAGSVRKQVEAKRKGFLSDVKKKEDALRKEQKDIEAKRKDMSKEELIKKAQDFDKRRLIARNSINAEKAKLDKSYAQAMNTLTKTIYEVCQELANEKKIDLVITRQNIIVGSMSLDITKDVLERMNKKLPKLTLK